MPQVALGLGRTVASHYRSFILNYYTRFAKILGASISEATTMQPNPRPCSVKGGRAAELPTNYDIMGA